MAKAKKPYYKKVLDERSKRSAGLSPGTNVHRPGAAGANIKHGHNPVKDEHFESPKAVSLSAGLTPGSSVNIKKPKGKTKTQQVKALKARIKALRERIKKEEMKEREVPGGGVSNSPGDKTSA
jgi:hypothetical protein